MAFFHVQSSSLWQRSTFIVQPGHGYIWRVSHRKVFDDDQKQDATGAFLGDDWAGAIKAMREILHLCSNLRHRMQVLHWWMPRICIQRRRRSTGAFRMPRWWRKLAMINTYIYILYYIYIYMYINTIKCDVPPKKDRQKAAEIVKRHSSILFGVTMHCVFYMYILYMCVCVPYLYVN